MLPPILPRPIMPICIALTPVACSAGHPAPTLATCSAQPTGGCLESPAAGIRPATGRFTPQAPGPNGRFGGQAGTQASDPTPVPGLNLGSRARSTIHILLAAQGVSGAVAVSPAPRLCSP